MKLARLSSSFCTYRIEIPEWHNGAYFIGCCSLAQVAAIPDAWTYEAFRDSVKPGDTIRLTIMGVFASSAEAEGLQRSLIAVENVQINLHSPRCQPPEKRGARGSKVRNNATGITYPSASAAARAVGATPSAMAQHLAGSFATLKGTTFERVEG